MKAHQVVISYSTADLEAAQDVCRMIEARGLICWMAPRDLPAGVKWAAAIMEAIEQAKAVVLIFSSDTNHSAHVKSEIHRAFDVGIPIYPLRLKNVFPSREILYWIQDSQWVDAFIPPLEQHVNRVAEAIHSMLGSVAPASPSTDAQKNSRKIVRSNGPKPRTRLLRWLLYVAGLLLVAGLWAGVCRHQGQQAFRRNRDSFLGAMPWLNWIQYDPTDYDPYRNLMPSEASIRTDLEVLRRHGFDGLITTTCRGTYRHIPRIAREVGFNMIIVGIWDLRDQEEMRFALEAKAYADAFCLGHLGLRTRYTYGELSRDVRRLRFKTRKPITTSELLVTYAAEPRLVQLGDFLFPDAHAYWHEGASPTSTWIQLVAKSQQAVRLVAGVHMPILLKMVSFPSAGADGLTLDAQREFYRIVVETGRHRGEVPSGVYFSFMAAFDPLWKTADMGWLEAERHTGLFTADRNPKPAVREVDWTNKPQ